jgi:hypothetical protein
MLRGLKGDRIPQLCYRGIAVGLSIEGYNGGWENSVTYWYTSLFIAQTELSAPCCQIQELSSVLICKENVSSKCEIGGFHGRDYEECRLLLYKNSVCTSQETHYFSATELSQLMLCNIRSFHGGDYEEWRLLGCYAVWLL